MASGVSRFPVLSAGVCDVDCLGEVAEVKFSILDVIKFALALFISLLLFYIDERLVPVVMLVVVLQMYWGAGND